MTLWSGLAGLREAEWQLCTPPAPSSPTRPLHPGTMSTTHRSLASQDPLGLPSSRDLPEQDCGPREARGRARTAAPTQCPLPPISSERPRLALSESGGHPGRRGLLVSLPATKGTRPSIPAEINQLTSRLEQLSWPLPRWESASGPHCPPTLCLHREKDLRSQEGEGPSHWGKRPVGPPLPLLLGLGPQGPQWRPTAPEVGGV